MNFVQAHSNKKHKCNKLKRGKCNKLKTDFEKSRELHCPTETTPLQQMQ